MYKNQLQELAQRSCFNLPSYSCIREGPDHAPRFKSTVNFKGETYESPTFSCTLRQAEHAAAEVALNTLSQRGPSRALAAKVLDETGVYKNLLQEAAHRAGLNLPTYSTVRSGSGHVPVFSCTVELGEMSFTGEPARTKKQAQKNAAIAAWSALKRLAQHSSLSTTSSSSSYSESKVSQEQEQVTVARVLVSSGSSGSTNSERSGCSLEQHGSIPVCRDLTPRAPSFYPMRYDNWAYHNCSPALDMYQMWQQEQQLQLQTHMLTIPTSNAPQFLPYVQPGFQPDHCLLVPATMQEPIPAFPRLVITSSRPSLHFSNPSFFSHIRGLSSVTIEEIQDEKKEESSGHNRSVINEPVLIQADPDSIITKQGQKDAKQKSVKTEIKVEGVRSHENQAGRSQQISSSNLDYNLGYVDLYLQKQYEFGSSQPYCIPIHQYPPRASPLGTQRAQADASMTRTLRPRRSPNNSATCMPVPPSMRSGIPLSASELRTRREKSGEVHPTLIAPPVRIRSVIPVCSAPPPKELQSSNQEEASRERRKEYTVAEDASRASSELDNLQI